jgi:hypothetical protein
MRATRIATGIATRIVPAALALTLLAACGGGSGAAADPGNGESAKKGPQVTADAAKALKEAGAVHISGTGSSDGKSLTIDLHLQGADAQGSITQAGQKLELIGTGGKVYAQAPAAFWTAQGLPAEAGATLAGKWVIMPADAGDVLPFTLDSLAAELVKPTDGTTSNDKVTTSTYQGQKVVVVTASDGSTTDVAATGKPYPLHSVNKGKDAGTVTLTDFGKRTTITAPAGALDLNQLAGGN